MHYCVTGIHFQEIKDNKSCHQVQQSILCSEVTVQPFVAHVNSTYVSVKVGFYGNTVY